MLTIMATDFNVTMEIKYVWRNAGIPRLMLIKKKESISKYCHGNLVSLQH